MVKFCPLLLSGLLFCVNLAYAQKQETERIERSLASLMPQPKPIRLTGVNDEHRLFIPISSRIKIDSMHLKLVLANSIALMKERSQLVISLNDRVVAQVQLSGIQPENSMEIKLPSDYFKPGYNQLSFKAVQHYTLECEDPAAPELWTEIDHLNSSLILTQRWLLLQPKLSQLQELIDPRLWEGYELKILTSPKITEDELLWGGLITQGAALFLKYVPIQVEPIALPTLSGNEQGKNFSGFNQQSLKGHDRVLIGTHKDISPYLSSTIANKIKNSFIGIFPLDESARHFVLVISGTNRDEVTRAAKAFSSLNFPYPDTDTVLITDLQYPKLQDYASVNSVRSKYKYRFDEFGFRTTTLRGTAMSPLDLKFSIPPDFFASENALLELDLHLTYGALFRRDSVLNILVNGRYQSVVPLTEERGAVYTHYKIRIPLQSFEPGLNTITFAAHMTPLYSGRCTLTQTNNLILTLFDDSSLSIPSFDHYVAMPNLTLFSKTGFPHTTQSANLNMIVGSLTAQTVGSAWMVAAKIAQRRGLPFQKFSISSNQSLPNESPLIVVGSLTSLTPSLLQGAPIDIGTFSKVAYPISNPMVQGTPITWWKKLFPSRGGVPTSLKPIQVVETLALGNSALAMQYRSTHSKLTTTVFTASSDESLVRGVKQLAQPVIWDNLSGDISLWQQGQEEVSSQRVGSIYYVGNVSLGTSLGEYFSQNTWLWLFIILLLLIALTWMTRKLLHRIYLKRLKTS